MIRSLRNFACENLSFISHSVQKIGTGRAGEKSGGGGKNRDFLTVLVFFYLFEPNFDIKHKSQEHNFLHVSAIWFAIVLPISKDFLRCSGVEKLKRICYQLCFFTPMVKRFLRIFAVFHNFWGSKGSGAIGCLYIKDRQLYALFGCGKLFFKKIADLWGFLTFSPTRGGGAILCTLFGWL